MILKRAWQLLLTVFFVLVISMLRSVTPEKIPVSNDRIFNDVKFKRCMKTSQTAGKPLKLLKKECKDYAEIIDGKSEAAKNCTELKRNEIGWTEEEIDLYCNKLWRGYR